MSKYFVKNYEEDKYRILVFEGSLTSKYLYQYSITVDGPNAIQRCMYGKIKNTKEAINKALINPDSYKESSIGEIHNILKEAIIKMIE